MPKKYKAKELPKLWRTINGELLVIKEMGTGHIVNCIRHLQDQLDRYGFVRDLEVCEPLFRQKLIYVEAFRRELFRRNNLFLAGKYQEPEQSAF